jgi:hypothetical protein
MTIAQYAPVTGTYKGTLYQGTGGYNTVPSNSVTVTEVLTQSTAANANGQYPITGTVSVTGYCSNSSSITGLAGGGYYSDPTGFTGGTVDPDASVVYLASVALTNCPTYVQGGFLTRQ